MPRRRELISQGSFSPAPSQPRLEGRAKNRPLSLTPYTVALSSLVGGLPRLSLQRSRSSCCFCTSAFPKRGLTSLLATMSSTSPASVASNHCEGPPWSYPDSMDGERLVVKVWVS